jgi:hypothetical protein
MTSNKMRSSARNFLVIAVCIVISIFYMSCGSKNDSSGPPAGLATTVNGGIAAGPNVLQISMGQTSICNVVYPNAPCVSVTICQPSTNNCQTISDILVDTGSYGLRVFSSVLAVATTPVTDGAAHPIAECAQFGSGNDWGPVVH